MNNQVINPISNWVRKDTTYAQLAQHLHTTKPKGYFFNLFANSNNEPVLVNVCCFLQANDTQPYSFVLNYKHQELMQLLQLISSYADYILVDDLKQLYHYCEDLVKFVITPKPLVVDMISLQRLVGDVLKTKPTSGNALVQQYYHTNLRSVYDYRSSLNQAHRARQLAFNKVLKQHGLSIQAIQQGIDELTAPVFWAQHPRVQALYEEFCDKSYLQNQFTNHPQLREEFMDLGCYLSNIGIQLFQDYLAKYRQTTVLKNEVYCLWPFYEIERNGIGVDETKVRNVFEILKPSKRKDLPDGLFKYYNATIALSRCKNQRFHPTFKTSGALTGRVSSNSQQFSNKPMEFNNQTLPSQKEMLVTDIQNGYTHFAFLDFNQFELRMATQICLNYTPDPNLLKAFLPIDCFKNNEAFDINNPSHLADLTGWTTLNNQPFVPVDIPTQLAIQNFGTEIVNDPNFAHYRKLAKTALFALMYGSGRKGLEWALQAMDDTLDHKTVMKWYDAYYDLFRDGLNQTARTIHKDYLTKKYLTNIFGRKYHTNTSILNVYKLFSWMVQGSCADLAKRVLALISNFLTQNRCKSRLVNMVHDEFVIELHRDEHHLIKPLLQTIENHLKTFFKIPFPLTVKCSEYTQANPKPWN